MDVSLLMKTFILKVMTVGYIENPSTNFEQSLFQAYISEGEPKMSSKLIQVTMLIVMYNVTGLGGKTAIISIKKV